MMDAASTIPAPGDVLVVVDVQNDFLPGGSLAVPDADAVLGPLNRLIDAFRRATLPIVATRDWHPADHCSFRAQGGIWPPHCVAGTPGAAFPPELRLPPDAHVVSKADTAGRDAYSGFEGTSLATLLREVGARRLVVGGLATDYCVLNTVRDALAEGHAVLLAADAIRAVEVTPGDGARAIAEMERLGATTFRAGDIA